MDNAKIRYAVIGAGNIAQVAVLPCFEHAKESSELVALVSNDAEKRAELGKRYELELTGDYAELEQLLVPEIDHFSRCIREDLEPEPSAEEAICDLRVVEAILKSAATGKPVPLEPWHRDRRPDISQVSKKPPVSKPDTVQAPSPSLK